MVGCREGGDTDCISAANRACSPGMPLPPPHNNMFSANACSTSLMELVMLVNSITNWCETIDINLSSSSDLSAADVNIELGSPARYVSWQGDANSRMFQSLGHTQVT